jgi:hypothetical protein
VHRGPPDEEVTMSESTERTPEADDTVDEVLAEQQTTEEDARSFPETGSDDDPGSMLNM